jgi:riboflavin transporter FmnP
MTQQWIDVAIVAVLVVGILGILMGFAVMALRSVLRFILSFGVSAIIWIVGEEFIRHMTGGRR